jgi:hypothetical protein
VLEDAEVIIQRFIVKLAIPRQISLVEQKRQYCDLAWAIPVNLRIIILDFLPSLKEGDS